ncbi:MAG: hypothetical protein U1G05_19800 [Kiritimatiellia bacterium]
MNWRALINDINLGQPGTGLAGPGDLMTLAATAGTIRPVQPAGCHSEAGSWRRHSGGGDGASETDFMLIEPSVDLGLNLTDTLVLGVSLGYRWLDGSDSDLLRDEDLEEPDRRGFPALRRILIESPVYNFY